MATATIYANKEHSVALTSTSSSVGTSKENHGPVGEGNSGWLWRELIKFSMAASDFNGITQITSVKLKFKTTGSVHCTNDNSQTIQVRRCTSSWTGTGGGSNDASDSWKTSADPHWTTKPSGDTITTKWFGTINDTTIYEIDITDIVEKMAPASIKKRDGTACDDLTNMGIFLRADDESNGKSFEIKTIRGSYSPRLVVTGTTTPTPQPPLNFQPSGTLANIPTDSDFSWDGDSADENPLTYWDIRFADGGTGSQPAYYGISNSTMPYSELTGDYNGDTPGVLYDYSAGISGVDVSNPAGLIAAMAADPTNPITLTRGHWYLFQVRHENSEGTNGDWGPISYFYIQDKPNTPTLVNPHGSKTLAPVKNIAEAAVWADSGAEAYAELSFKYTHPNGLACAGYRIKWAGTEYTEYLFSPASGEGEDAEYTFVVQSPTKIARNTATTYQVQTMDENNQWSDYTTEISVKVQWAQGVFSHTHGSGTGNFDFATAGFTGGNSVRSAFLFRPGSGSWLPAIGNVEPGTVMDVLVRFCTDNTAVNPTMADMTMEWLSSGSLPPDSWSLDGTGFSLSLDQSRRRFGRRCAKVTIGTGQWGFLYPDYGGDDPDLIVTPGETYTYSIFVLTDTALTNDLRIKWNDENNTNRRETTITGSGDTSGEWVRITDSFTIPDGVTRISPVTVINNGSAVDENKVVYFDSAQMEEGEVTTQWKPGGIGPAVSLDVGGIQVDKSLGGIFRLLSGDAAQSVLMENALTFKRLASGVKRTLSVNSSGALEVDGDLNVSGDISATNYPPTIARTTPVTNVYDANATWTKPSGLSHIVVMVQGAGGGGGGCVNPGTGKGSAGGAGGGGGFAQKILSASDLASASTLSVVVGSGGSGGNTAGTNGTAGGASTVSGTGITTIQGSGGGVGYGHTSGASGNSGKDGGDGGSHSGGDWGASGGDGGASRVAGGVVAMSGCGGDSFLGGGGMGELNANGKWGNGKGGGGGGGTQTGNASGRSGGTGSAGRVIIIEHYLPTLS